MLDVQISVPNRHGHIMVAEQQRESLLTVMGREALVIYGVTDPFGKLKTEIKTCNSINLNLYYIKT